MAKKVKVPSEMRIRVLKSFLSPLHVGLLKVGQELNVPEGRFWLRRLMDKDCAKIKPVPQSKPKTSKASKEVKGSK